VSSASDSSAGLTFAWIENRGRGLALLGFLVVSVAAHGSLFLLFQVVYPQRVTIPPPAQQIALLTPSTPEHDALLRWIAAEDPALVATTAHVMPEGLLDVPYRASFETLRTAPRFAPQEEEAVQYPPAKDFAALLRSVAAPPAAPDPKPAPAPSRLELSETLLSRAPSAPPAFQTEASAPLQPARFLLGVTDRGEVRFTFLQSSSGDARADAQAAAQLARASFGHGEMPIAWGFATVHWGGDAYRAAPRKAP
jgi:hypothetical protein